MLFLKNKQIYTVVTVGIFTSSLYSKDLLVAYVTRDLIEHLRKQIKFNSIQK